MTNAEIRKIKELYENLASLCDSYDKNGWNDHYPDIILRETLHVDIIQFICYLSASDGRIADSEADIFGFFTDLGFTTKEELHKIIDDFEIYSYDFESEPPFILKLLRDIEKKLIRRNLVDSSLSILDVVAETFELIGSAVISIDGGVTYNEKRDLNIYMNTINQYIAEQKNSLCSDYLLNEW